MTSVYKRKLRLFADLVTLTINRMSIKRPRILLTLPGAVNSVGAEHHHSQRKISAPQISQKEASQPRRLAEETITIALLPLPRMRRFRDVAR